MSDLSTLNEDEIKNRLEELRIKYKSITDDILPKLRTANLIEKEITLLITELEKR